MDEVLGWMKQGTTDHRVRKLGRMKQGATDHRGDENGVDAAEPLITG